MTAYADYAYYRDNFHGSTVSESDFPGLAVKASAFIDRLTFNRLRSADIIPDEAKMATCAVAERIQVVEKSGVLNVNAAVKSENNDGYSVSYNDFSLVRAQLYTDYEDAALPYLYGTGLMYAGVDLPKGRCCR
nr:MAG TPA: Head Tail Connector Protein [Caudoviricetes sp.]